MTKTSPPPVRLPQKIVDDPELFAFFQELTKSVYLLWQHSRNAQLTASETTITHTAPSTADYAVQDLTSTTPFGFVTKDEGNTVLQVIANLQARVSELEDHLTGN